MAIAHDTETLTATSTVTWATNHTPIGTPRGVVVVISANITTNNLGAVTYGGVAMTPIVSAVDTSEAGRIDIYFLGSGIPTGTQSVSIAFTGAGGTKRAEIYTMTAAADTIVDTSNFVNTTTAANPSLTLNTTAGVPTCIYYGLWSGNAAVVTTVEAGSIHVAGHDYGNFVWMTARKTHTGGSTTIGYTLISEDFAHAGVAIEEAVSADPTRPQRIYINRSAAIRVATR